MLAAVLLTAVIVLLGAVLASRDHGGKPRATYPIATGTVASMATHTPALPTSTRSPTRVPTTTTPIATPTSTVIPTTGPVATATPLPVAVADFIGVYDASTDGDTGAVAARWIASVSGNGDDTTITIFFDERSQLDLRGALRADGSADLTGRGTSEADVGLVFIGTGRATFLEVDGVQHVTGAFHDDTILGLSTTFHLERPIAGKPRRFGGTYVFTFTPSPGGCDCTTTATIKIKTDPDGFGTLVLAADEYDDRHTHQGTFEPGPCLVTASGRVRCTLTYQPTSAQSAGRDVSSYPVTLTGQMTARRGTVTGSGVSAAATFAGSWTATR